MWQSETVTTPVFPFVSFTSLEGAEFCIPRSRITHIETYRDGGELDHSKTFVNFENPNERGQKTIHAGVDMPLKVFTETVMKPAYEGQKTSTG